MEETSQSDDVPSVEDDLPLESREDQEEASKPSESDDTEMGDVTESIEAQPEALASDDQEAQGESRLDASSLDEDVRSAARQVVQQGDRELDSDGTAAEVFDPALRDRIAQHDPQRGRRDSGEPDRVRDFLGDETIYGDEYCFRLSEVQHSGSVIVFSIPCPSDSGGRFSLDPDRER